MNLLLDTHVLLWWLDDPTELKEAARKTIADPSNQVFVSAAVIWEIVIKSSLGKLQVPDDLESVVERSRFTHLPVTSVHALAVHELPPHHRDPFDRILAAQALREEATLVTRDERLKHYPCNILGA